MVKSMKPVRGSGATSFAGSASKRAAWLCGIACLLLLVLLAGEGLRRACAQQASLPVIDPPGMAAKTAATQAQKTGEPGQQQDDHEQQQTSFSLPAIDPPSAAGKSASPALNGAQPGQQQDAGAGQQAEPATDPNQPEPARECADLLKMATDLKAAVDKTTQDTLSVTVVRKANQIEEFARKVRLGSGKS